MNLTSPNQRFNLVIHQLFQKTPSELAQIPDGDWLKIELLEIAVSEVIAGDDCG